MGRFFQLNLFHREIKRRITSVVKVMPGEGDDGGGHADEAELGEQLGLDGGERGLLQVEDHGRPRPERHPELHPELGGDTQEGSEGQVLHARKQESMKHEDDVGGHS